MSAWHRTELYNLLHGSVLVQDFSRGNDDASRRHGRQGAHLFLRSSKDILARVIRSLINRLTVYRNPAGIARRKADDSKSNSKDSDTNVNDAASIKPTSTEKLQSVSNEGLH